MAEDVEFPIFFTLTELKDLISQGLPPHIWHKVNNAISVVECGEPCCDEMSFTRPM